ncbi:FHA domain-containing protein [Dactylosporangium sp. CA-139066]|uniref:FHA domain-containing protein n=1 Tax=Dactylosporangium sp. CA-139066 TaxID=3239930 RepID=UPI003D8E52D4
MARLICPASRLEELNDGTFCEPHRLRMEPAPDDAVPADDAIPACSDTAPHDAERRCPDCGEPAYADNTYCLMCGSYLVVSRLAATVEPRDGAPFTVTAGKSVGLGRDPEFSPYADRFTGFDNVSRRHATLVVDPKHGVDLVPVKTTNPTFINGRIVAPMVAHRLHDRDEIRFGSRFTAVVRITPSEHEEHQ